MRWVKYVGKYGRNVFLDDVIMDGKPDTIDGSKMPEDVKKRKQYAFRWDEEAKEYVLHLRKRVNTPTEKQYWTEANKDINEKFDAPKGRPLIIVRRP
jgi:hypothetical protein